MIFILHSVAKFSTFVGHALSLVSQFIFTKTTTNPRCISYFVCFTKFFYLVFYPVSHRPHYFFLVHAKFLVFIELQQPFPIIPKPIWPFSGIAFFYAT